MTLESKLSGAAWAISVISGQVVGKIYDTPLINENNLPDQTHLLMTGMNYLAGWGITVAGLCLTGKINFEQKEVDNIPLWVKGVGAGMLSSLGYIISTVVYNSIVNG